ncbi:MAG: NAD(+)/NADH kinase [Thermaerobacter sp.]|nr:NAD(+) kinase [Bacillota bacterium]REJ32783.1 MAG: NAD(+) kinase [Bacillota bacterium]
MSGTLGRIHLFAHAGDRAQQVKDRLARMLEMAGMQLVDEPAGPDDLVISLGGDGTFLDALRRYRAVDPVFCGINAGRLGFLQEADSDNLVAAVDRIVQGRYTISRLPLLHVEPFDTEAFNDVVVERSDTRTLRLVLHVDGQELGPVVADGILVATPSGSTAYAVAAGGAVVHPDSDVMQVVTINAHPSRLTLTPAFPLVLPGDSVVEIGIEGNPRRLPRLVVDGVETPLETGITVRVRKSPRSVRVLRLGLGGYWERLRAKFS